MSEKHTLCSCSITASEIQLCPLHEATEEMYDALRAAEGHLSELLTDKQWHPIGHCPVLDVVRAALAKAEGKS